MRLRPRHIAGAGVPVLAAVHAAMEPAIVPIPETTIIPIAEPEIVAVTEAAPPLPSTTKPDPSPTSAVIGGVAAIVRITWRVIVGGRIIPRSRHTKTEPDYDARVGWRRHCRRGAHHR